MKNTKTAFLLGVLATVGALSITAFAVNALDITAQLRPDYTIRVDGQTQTFTDANGKVVSPISYEGTTYLPVRAIGGLMGKDVAWDATTLTIDLTEPTVDNAGVSAGDMGAEAATAIALNDAGFAKSEVLGLQVERDYDDGVLEYDIEFHHGVNEYDYTIDAGTGDILEKSVDIEDDLY